MIHQYRYAAGGFVFEIPAGLRHEGEDWETCARRELEEETGFAGQEFVPLTSFFTTPGFTDEVIHLFLATGLSEGRVQRDEDEYIEVVKLPLSRALAMIRKGEIRDGKSIVGLFLAQQFLRDREGWGGV